jgi:hypothetical protein
MPANDPAPNPLRLIVPADAADSNSQRGERKSALAFFTIFGGGLFVAAIFVLWPFGNITSFQWMIAGVLSAVGLIFVAVFIFQWRTPTRNLARAKTICYIGTVTAKHERSIGDRDVFVIYMGEREFEIAGALYRHLKIGDDLAVREWIDNGGYIGHTGDPRRIAALKERALPS